MYQSKIRHIAIDFNPRSHEGSDFITTLSSRLADNFNPRSHEGSDMRFGISGSKFSDFNPRSHEGSDPKFFSGESGSTISIHAPTRGATGKI